GIQGVMDRFGQIEPKVLVACDGYQYNGKWIDLSERLRTLQKQLAPQLLVVVPGKGEHTAMSEGQDWTAWLDNAAVAPPFERVPFNHPLYILYSSGTTGAPKCIVHGTGGTLIQHVKEHHLHGDLSRDDVLFYFTTC